MANETTYSSAADVRATHVLNRNVHMLLTDMTDLRKLCTQYEFGEGGSLTTKVGAVQGSYSMSAPGENTAVANTALVDASLLLTPARYALRFENTDLFSISGGGAGVDDEMLVKIIANSVSQTATGILAALFPSISTNVGGGAGVDFSVDYAFDAMFALNVATAGGRQAFVLKPHSFNELITSLRGETGALQFLPATLDVMAMKGVGFMGTWLGRDIYSTSHVVEGSGVANNALISEGAFALLEPPVGRMVPRIDRKIAFADSSVFVTDAYDDEKATFRKIGNYYNATAEQEDARAVLIASDDT